MSVAQMVQELKALPKEEREKSLRELLQNFYPPKALERFWRRFIHPEVPEDFWDAAEEVEDGKAIEMKDEHFKNPPV